MRQIFLECGRRLVAAGVLQAVEDVFYFSLAELKSVLGQPLPWHTGNRRVAGCQKSWQPSIDERKKTAERFANIAPPFHLGSLPLGAPPEDPISRMFLKIEGAGPGLSEETNELRGSPGAPGLVRGRVKILRVLGDAVKLQPGDILVAESTAPPWTPLFASVAGVITDSGGALSHSAVIAREYGIPAVVGAGTATRRLMDGEMVEVNGHLGIVRIGE